MHYTLKPFIFTALVFPIITQGMEPQDKKIKLDDQLRDVIADTVLQDWPQQYRIELGKQMAEAAENWDWETVKMLINQKADPNQKAPSIGDSTLIIAADENLLEIVQTLMAEGANINQKNLEGFTALMFAAYRNNIEIVQTLICAGADLNHKTYNDHTALSLATLAENSEICRMIVQAHIDRIALQKECVYTTSLCLKRLFGMQYPHIRNIFRPILGAMCKESRQAMLDDINRIENESIKKELLALCNREQHQNWFSPCTIC